MRTKTLAILKESFGKNFSIPLPEIDETEYRKTPKEAAARFFIQNSINVIKDPEITSRRAVEVMEKQGAYQFRESGDEYYFNTAYQNLTKQNLIDMSWCIESSYMFAWVFQVMRRNPLWKNVTMSMTQYAKTPPNTPFEQFYVKYKMRPVKEILETADILYCLHWLLLEEEPAVKKVSIGNVIERRHVLEWLISDAKWYDVSLDT